MGYIIRHRVTNKILFEGDTLVNVNLENADLRSYNFRYHDLRGVRLRGALLSKCDFTGADLSGAHLTNTDLRDAIMNDTILLRTGFNGANMEGVNFHRAEFGNTIFSGTNLSLTGLFFLNVGGSKSYIQKDMTTVKGYTMATSKWVKMDLDDIYKLGGYDLVGYCTVHMADLRKAIRGMINLKQGQVSKLKVSQTWSAGQVKNWVKGH